ncbi:hypothetical protein [Pseudogulbenkiania ferrooxidans]|uniref:hypothetical protein n=1 Tax=Pseudogulbenkiania ferrooxidans TaxID=549169 RepID=UPI0012692554|nr:hypothetical protein [Pseudogulbenkiania ferrooxidans]
MLEKINITAIVKEHLQTLKRGSCTEISTWEVTLFFAIPIVIALPLAIYFDISSDFVNGIVTAASIFAGLLLNLLVLIYTVLSRQRQPAKNDKEKQRLVIFKQVLKETFANISFCILTSVILVAVCLLSYIKGGIFPKGNHFLIYFLISQLILTLLMILKRIHKLFDFEISNQEESDTTKK